MSKSLRRASGWEVLSSPLVSLRSERRSPELQSHLEFRLPSRDAGFTKETSGSTSQTGAQGPPGKLTKQPLLQPPRTKGKIHNVFSRNTDLNSKILGGEG